MNGPHAATGDSSNGPQNYTDLHGQQERQALTSDLYYQCSSVANRDLE
jgi:hypothetical protein